MAVLNTVNEALKFFNEQFPEGSSYRGAEEAQIAQGRVFTGRAVPGVGLQRMGWQIQFLTTLYDKIGPNHSDSYRVMSAIVHNLNSFYTTPIHTKEEATIDIPSGSTAWEAGVVEIDPGYPIMLVALSMLRKSTHAYNNLGVNGSGDSQAYLNTALTRHYQKILYHCQNSGHGKTLMTDPGSFGTTSPTVRSFKTADGSTFKVANGVVNTTYMMLGSLAYYHDVVLSHSQTEVENDPLYTNIFNAGVNLINAFGNAVDSDSVSIAIGGGAKGTIWAQLRAPYVSSGYDSYVGASLVWLGHGIVPTNNIYALTESTLVTASIKLSNYYKNYVLANRSNAPMAMVPLTHGTPATLSGSTFTAAKTFFGTQTPTSNEVLNLTGLINDHPYSTGYLYTFANNGESDFINKVDKAVRESGEGLWRSTVEMGTTSSIVAYGRRGEAAGHRTLSGLAGLLQRGIPTVTNGCNS